LDTGIAVMLQRCNAVEGLSNGLTTENTESTEEAFWAFLQEGAGSQRRAGVFAGVVPALTSSTLLARRMPKVGTARRAVPRFRCAAPFFCSPRPSQAGRLRYKKWDPCGEASLPFIDGRCRAGGPFRIKNEFKTNTWKQSL
jgi:hypothetical protein